MKTDLKEKKLFFILGLPGGGTTIINNIFNSLYDGFSLGEPHWMYRLYQIRGQKDPINIVKARSTGKVRNFFNKITSDKDILENGIIPTLYNNNFNLGGYKETYNPDHLQYHKSLFYKNYDKMDFIILIVRNPRKFSKKRDENILQAYKDFYEFSKLEKVKILIYDDFCETPELLNNLLPFNILGELDLKPTGHNYGDFIAHKSYKINKAKDYKNLVVDENFYNELLEFFYKIKGL